MIKSNFGQITRFPGLFFKNRSFLSYSSWSTETKHVSVYSQVFFAQDLHFSHFRVDSSNGVAKIFHQNIDIFCVRTWFKRYIFKFHTGLDPRAAMVMEAVYQGIKWKLVELLFLENKHKWPFHRYCQQCRSGSQFA